MVRGRTLTLSLKKTVTNMANKKIVMLISAVAIVASLGFGVRLGAQYFSPPPPLAIAQLLPTPKLLPEFKLENHRGHTIDIQVFRDHWSLVFFGFTSCPDFCPLELQKLAKVLRLNNNQYPLQVLFVSVDPERDTPDKLAEYVGFFNPDIVGVRGSNSELAKFAQFFGAAYDRSVIIEGKLLTVPAGINMPTNAGDQYQVNHSMRIFVVNPAGEYVGTFTPPYEAEKLLADMQELMER
jgi:protein SCO1/2